MLLKAAKQTDRWAQKQYHLVEEIKTKNFLCMYAFWVDMLQHENLLLIFRWAK